MESYLETQVLAAKTHTPSDAWRVVCGQLRGDLSKSLFETWVEPLLPLTYRDGVFTLAAANPYTRDWVDDRLKPRLTSLLQAVYNQPLRLEVVVAGYSTEEEVESETEPEIESAPANIQPQAPASKRKVMLQRAYGSKRAGVIQPERGMFLTLYLFNHWLPLLGHSAFSVILAARSLCYWNPMTGELRNLIETEMGDLAARAAVSVRTVKDVLNNELVRRYFIRYKVRRLMTPNGVRTAGITLQVRMDDPVTPEDQVSYNLSEDEHWYLPEFDPEDATDESI